MTDTIRSGLNNVRLGLAAGTTITGTNTTLPGNLTIPGSAAIAGSLTATSASISGTITLSNIQPASSETGVLIGNALFGGSPQQSYTTNNTAGNVTYTPSQLFGGFILRFAGTNNVYTDTLPSAASLFAACNNTVGATFDFSMYPGYSMTIATGSGGLIYGGLLGNNGGFESYAGYSLTQGGTSIFLPNSAVYLFFVIITSATTYTVFIK